MSGWCTAGNDQEVDGEVLLLAAPLSEGANETSPKERKKQDTQRQTFATFDEVNKEHPEQVANASPCTPPPQPLSPFESVTV